MIEMDNDALSVWVVHTLALASGLLPECGLLPEVMEKMLIGLLEEVANQINPMLMDSVLTRETRQQLIDATFAKAEALRTHREQIETPVRLLQDPA